MYKNSLEQKMDSIEVPYEVNTVVNIAIKRGKRDKGLKKLRAGACSFAILIALFALCVNTVPIFSDQIDNIPILSIFINLLKTDKCISSVVNDGLTVNINKRVIDNNIELMVDSIINDGKFVIINYTLKGINKDTSSKILRLSDYIIKDDNGTILAEAFNGTIINPDSKLLSEGTVHKIEKDQKNANVLTGEMISLIWSDTKNKLPDSITLICSSLMEIDRNNKNVEIKNISGNWEISIPTAVNKNVKPIRFAAKKIITKYGTFNIEPIEVYPIKTVVKFTSENMLDFDLNLYIMDEKGNIYRESSGSSIGGRDFTSIIDSCYYSDSNSFYLVAKEEEMNVKKAEEVFRIKIK